MDIDGVTVVDLEVHPDARGSFVEFYRESWLPTARSALQGNISRSTAGSLRAMHFHRRQWDYWFVVAGEMFVALADLRTGSPTERAISTLRLSAETPAGLVHPARGRPRVPRGDRPRSRIPGRPVLRRLGRVGDRLERPGARDRLARRRSRPVRPGSEQPEPAEALRDPVPYRPDRGLTSSAGGRTLPPVPARDRAGAG